jgi:serine O-acetyltransferase
MILALRIYRVANWCYRHRVPVLPFLLKGLNRVMFAVVLPPSATLGRNVLLSYEGLGTVIHRRAQIGDDTTIGAGVTIGGRSGSKGVPRIGKGVLIGTGAKLIGDIRIGDYASIGANAVVLSDVPDYAVAVGIPARVVRINRPEDLPNYRAFQEN